MKFRTEYIPEKSTLTLTPSLPVALVGSCFTDNMASRMRGALWRAENPLGTLFNPLSIADALSLVCDGGQNLTLSNSFLTAADGTTRSWMFDSRFAALTQEDCGAAVREACGRMAEVMGKGKVLCVTFGTAWCYFLRESGTLVANCHKMPQALFERRRVSADEIAEVWRDLIKKLARRWPGLRIIFTVSPVRHLKDGFAGNFRSKATLALAVEKICAESEGCHYFPAYEILNDDLRDYRFYASDLVHPSDEGVEYIWEIFRKTFLDREGEELLKEGERLARACAHRPLPTASSCESSELSRIREVRRREIIGQMLHLRERHETLQPGAPGLIVPDQIREDRRAPFCSSAF